MSESYSVEAFLRADTTGFVRGFQVAAAAAADFQRDVRNLDTSGIENAGRQFEQVGDKMQKAGRGMMKAGGFLTAGVTLPLVAAGAASVNSAIEFESAFAGVRKTVDATESEFADLEQGIRNMAKELPASTTEISAVAEAAGQLGIQKESILGFTRTMVDLGESTNLTAEEAATSFAQFANVVGMPQDNFDRLGSSVVALGNSMATTEADIVNMAMRLSGTGAQVGLSEAQIMALSATMASVGINAEAGGSAMSTVMKKISNAVADGGDEMALFAKSADMTSAEFSEAWKNDPITALDSFIKGLSASGESGENLNAILGDLGIKGIQETDTLLRLAGASDLLSGAVDTSSAAWEANTALSDEAAQRYATTESKIAMMKNTFNDLAITIGNVLLPMFNQLLDFITPMVDRLANMSEKNVKLSVVFAALAAAVGPLVVAFGGLITFAGMVVSNFGILLQRFAPIIARHAALKTAVGLLGRAFSLLFGPVGAAIALLATLTPVFIKLYQDNEKFRAVVDTVWNFIKTTIQTVVQAVVSFVMSVWGELVAFWNENGAMIMEATSNVWNVIQKVVSVAMDVISAVFKAVWPVIQVLVATVWDNIKGVISGALDIIMGLVKAFSGLFTGNWSAMWDGVKQMFSGAVEFLWNAVQLMLWGKMLKGLATFAGAFRSQIGTFWNTVKTVFNTAINSIKAFFTAGFQSMRSTATANMTTISNFIRATMNAIKSVVSSIFNTIKSVFTSSLSTIFNAVRTRFTSVVNTIRTTMGNALTTIKNILKNMVSAVTGRARDFLNAGKALIRGLVNGIKSMGAHALTAITGLITGVIDKAKSLFGIRSPSRVFAGIGAFLSEGLANGIDDEARVAIKSASTLSKSVTNAFNPEMMLSKTDYSSQLNGMTGKLKQQVSSQVSSQLTVNRQPAQINMNLGGRTYKAFVEDITNGQTQQINLVEQYGQ